MGLERGAFEHQKLVDPVTYSFVTKDGKVAFTITLSRAFFPRVGWVLRLLQRKLLDAVDPPLRLLADDSPQPPKRQGPRVALGPAGYPWQQ